MPFRLMPLRLMPLSVMAADAVADTSALVATAKIVKNRFMLRGPPRFALAISAPPPDMAIAELGTPESPCELCFSLRVRQRVLQKIQHPPPARRVLLTTRRGASRLRRCR